MLLAILSGILSALSLPTVLGGRLLPPLGGLAWIALVPLLAAIRGAAPRKALRIGFVAGFVHYAVTLYWMFIALHTYGEVSVPFSALGLLGAVLIECSFTTAACWSASVLEGRRIPLWISFPPVWIVFELLRHAIPFGGFGWGSLAYSQRGFLTLLQILDVTGIYGLLFLIVLGNAVLEEILAWRRALVARFPVTAALVFAVSLSAALVYGHLRLEDVREAQKKAQTLRVAMIQGNIPQDETWQEQNTPEIILRQVVMTDKVETERPDLVIWPEAAFPNVVGPEVTQLEEVASLRVPLLTGVVSFEGHLPEEWPPKPEDHFALHNSAFLVTPGGTIAERYDKVHLVPLGEYVPLGNIFFFVQQIVPEMTSFTPGSGWHVLTLKGEGVPFGVTICYEDLFPEISRTFTREGARFLVNVTNDGWYEHSSAVFQHFDFSRYRAVENRRAMARATNTGKTAFFAPTGEEIAAAPVFDRATLTADIPLMSDVSEMTIYTRYGDVFGWGCVLGTALLGVVALTRKEHG